MQVRPLLVIAALLAGCQTVGQPPVPASTALPAVNIGDPGPMPSKGRARPEKPGHAWGLGEKYWRITDDGKGSFYNCLGYATCSSVFGYRELPSDDPGTMSGSRQTMGKSDRYFLSLGWTISADCRPAKGVRKVVAYCNPGANGRVDPDDDVVHFAKQYRDDWWEGKMGCSVEAGSEQPPRILYPGVGAIDYAGGVPCRCYEMGLAKLVQYIRSRVLPEIERQRNNLKPFPSTPDLDAAEREANERIKELGDATKTEGSGP